MNEFLSRFELYKQRYKHHLEKDIDWLKYMYTEYHPIARPGLKVIREHCDFYAKRYLDDIDIDVLAKILYHNLRFEYHVNWDVDSLLTEYLKAHTEVGRLK